MSASTKANTFNEQEIIMGPQPFFEQMLDTIKAYPFKAFAFAIITHTIAFAIGCLAAA